MRSDTGNLSTPTTATPVTSTISSNGSDALSHSLSRQNTLNSLSTSSTPNLNDLNQLFSSSTELSVCSAPGFQIIQIYFAQNVELVELYLLLFALLFDVQRIRPLPRESKLDLHCICQFVFDKPFDSEQTHFSKINTDVSLDISIILLSMIRNLMNTPPSKPADQETKDYAIILMQSRNLAFLFYIGCRGVQLIFLKKSAVKNTIK